MSWDSDPLVLPQGRSWRSCRSLRGGGQLPDVLSLPSPSRLGGGGPLGSQQKLQSTRSEPSPHSLLREVYDFPTRGLVSMTRWAFVLQEFVDSDLLVVINNHKASALITIKLLLHNHKASALIP